MNDKNTDLVSPERELASAVSRLREGVQGIERFKAASLSLEEVAELNKKLLTELDGAVAGVKQGANSLSERGIREFNETLTSSISALRQVICDDVARVMRKSTDDLQEGQKRTTAEIKAGIEKVESQLLEDSRARSQLVIAAVDQSLDKKIEIIKEQTATSFAGAKKIAYVIGGINLILLGLLVFKVFAA